MDQSQQTSYPAGMDGDLRQAAGEIQADPMAADTTDSRMHPRPWLGILSVLIALSAPVVQVLLGPWFNSTFPFPMDRFVSLWVFWIAMLIALGIARYAEGYPLALFGFTRSQKTLRTRLLEWILAMVAALVVAAVVILFSTYVRERITGEPAPVLKMTRMLPFWVLLPAWVTGAFTEEVLFRSFSIERLTPLIGRRWLAALITVITFAGLHSLTWDWIHVLTAVLPGGVLLTLFYLWRRNLALNVIIHAVINAPLLLLPLIAPYM